MLISNKFIRGNIDRRRHFILHWPHLIPFIKRDSLFFHDIFLSVPFPFLLPVDWGKNRKRKVRKKSRTKSTGFRNGVVVRLVEKVKIKHTECRRCFLELSEIPSFSNIYGEASVCRIPRPSADHLHSAQWITHGIHALGLL